MVPQKAEYVWFNGRLVPWYEAKVHVLTHAFNYGTAAFEGIRAYPDGDEMYVFRLREHVERLFRTCKIYGFRFSYTFDEITGACIEVVRANNFHERTYIRPLVYVAGVGIGIGFSGQPVDAAVAAVPFDSYFKGFKGGVDAVVSTWRKVPEQSMPPSAKITGHYANSVLAKMEAVENGYGEAILLDMDGKVSEGTGENIFIVKGGKLVTPPLSAGILEGITRETIFQLAEDDGIEVVKRDLVRSELYTCDEAFFCGTAAEITYIRSVDKKLIGEGTVGPVTRRLSSLYQKAVVGKLAGHERWATPVYRIDESYEPGSRQKARVSQPH